MSDSPAKPCAICGGECDGRPRIKDAKGRYMHRKCAEARKAAGATGRPKQRPAQVQAPAGGVMDLLVDDAISQAPEPCPGCGMPCPKGAVICVKCGHNAATGKKLKSRVEKELSPAKVQAGGGGGAATAVAGASIDPILWIIGGCVGGAIGAAIWASLAYTLRVELVWISWLVGLMTGAGVLLGARGDGGLLPGTVAAFLAIISIGAGKFAALSADAADFIEETGAISEVWSPDDITDEEALQFLADNIAQNRMDQEIEMDWPQVTLDSISFSNEFNEETNSGPVIDLDQPHAVSWAAIEYAAYWPDGYPQDIRDEVNERWDGINEAGRLGVRNRVINSYEIEAQEFEEAVETFVVEEGFWMTFGPKDAVFMTLAIITAFGIAFKDF